MENVISAAVQNSDCLKPIANVGETLYQNICTGLPGGTVLWGTIEWSGFVLISALLVLLFGVIGTGVYKMATD